MRRERRPPAHPARALPASAAVLSRAAARTRHSARVLATRAPNRTLRDALAEECARCEALRSEQQLSMETTTSVDHELRAMEDAVPELDALHADARCRAEASLRLVRIVGNGVAAVLKKIVKAAGPTPIGYRAPLDDDDAAEQQAERNVQAERSVQAERNSMQVAAPAPALKKEALRGRASVPAHHARENSGLGAAAAARLARKQSTLAPSSCRLRGVSSPPPFRLLYPRHADSLDPADAALLETSLEQMRKLEGRFGHLMETTVLTPAALSRLAKAANASTSAVLGSAMTCADEAGPAAPAAADSSRAVPPTPPPPSPLGTSLSRMASGVLHGLCRQLSLTGAEIALPTTDPSFRNERVKFDDADAPERAHADRRLRPRTNSTLWLEQEQQRASPLLPLDDGAGGGDAPDAPGGGGDGEGRSAPVHAERGAAFRGGDRSDAESDELDDEEAELYRLTHKARARTRPARLAAPSPLRRSLARGAGQACRRGVTVLTALRPHPLAPGSLPRLAHHHPQARPSRLREDAQEKGGGRRLASQVAAQARLAS